MSRRRMSAKRLAELREQLPTALVPPDVQVEMLRAIEAERREVDRLRDALASFGGVR